MDCKAENQTLKEGMGGMAPLYNAAAPLCPSSILSEDDVTQ